MFRCKACTITRNEAYFSYAAMTADKHNAANERFSTAWPPSPQEQHMTTPELKKFIQENCGDPAVGITSMDDFTPQEIKNMEESNRTMAAYTPLISADMPVFWYGVPTETPSVSAGTRMTAKSSRSMLPWFVVHGGG